MQSLRNYLQYAATNGKRLGDAEITGEPLNAFEAEVFDCLSVNGLRLIPQMGASLFRIDMVAEHPAKPVRYVLVVQLDWSEMTGNPFSVSQLIVRYLCYDQHGFLVLYCWRSRLNYSGEGH